MKILCKKYHISLISFLYKNLTTCLSVIQHESVITVIQPQKPSAPPFSKPPRRTYILIRWSSNVNRACFLRHPTHTLALAASLFPGRKRDARRPRGWNEESELQHAPRKGGDAAAAPPPESKVDYIISPPPSRAYGSLSSPGPPPPPRHFVNVKSFIDPRRCAAAAEETREQRGRERENISPGEHRRELLLCAFRRSGGGGGKSDAR